MSKDSVVQVIVIMAVCGALVAGLGFWLGTPDKASEEVVSKINEPLTAPLSADQLEAYQVDMTNNDNPVAVFSTNLGIIEFELFENNMPITTGNFEKLASEGFYDGVKFHRVIDGFMIQGGDPITKTEEYLRYGTGGPGYSIADEHVSGEYLTNVRGTISMANSGPNSGGSQFFINLGDNTNLDFDKQPLSSKHPVFGRVLSGMSVVDAIGKTEVNERDLPIDDVVIESIKIERRN